jgi:Putative zincin peptidase
MQTNNTRESNSAASAEHKRDLSISMLRANLLALAIGVPVAIAQIGLYAALRGDVQVSVGLLDGLQWLTVLLVSVAAHELIHGLTWQALTRSSPAAVSYGMQWQTLTPFAHLTKPIEVGIYRIGGLMPGLVLGMLPYLLGLALGNTILLCWCCGCCAASRAGPWWKIIRRGSAAMCSKPRAGRSRPDAERGFVRRRRHPTVCAPLNARENRPNQWPISILR